MRSTGTPKRSAAGTYASERTAIGPCRARIRATSKSSIGTGSRGSGLTASTGAASASVPPSISRFMLILNMVTVGSWRIDSAPLRRFSASSVPSSPSFESGATAIVNQRLKSWLRR